MAVNRPVYWRRMKEIVVMKKICMSYDEGNRETEEIVMMTCEKKAWQWEERAEKWREYMILLLIWTIWWLWREDMVIPDIDMKRNIVKWPYVLWSNDYWRNIANDQYVWKILMWWNNDEEGVYQSIITLKNLLLLCIIQLLVMVLFNTNMREWWWAVMPLTREEMLFSNLTLLFWKLYKWYY